VHPKADEAAKASFENKIGTYEGERRPVYYLDESGFAMDMPRRHGYSMKGQRCVGKHDWHAKGRINVIGALLGNELVTACLFESTINSDVFHAWVTQDLLHQLPANAVIVMDNATFHKRQDTQLAILDAGLTLEYLPPYSPDLNPIEKKWAQAKAIRRKHRCDVYTLFQQYLL
jgi:transposase